MSQPEAPFPRIPENPDQLRRLREEAMRRMDREDWPEPAPVYGGPSMAGSREPERPEPVTIYGGPPFGGGGNGRMTRRLTLIGLLLMLIGGVGALVAWFLGHRSPTPAPVYGGPPPPTPHP